MSLTIINKVTLKYRFNDVKLNVVLEDYKKTINKIIDVLREGPTIDIRCDDTINTVAWDSTTAGVLDALRDAMIANGLIAAE